MYVHQHQARYEPSSVGALMDTSFLLQARNDGLVAQTIDRADDTVTLQGSTTLWQRCWSYVAPVAAPKH